MCKKDDIRKILRQGFLFVIASGIGFLINTGVTVFLHEVLGISPGISFAVALACAYAANFFNNRKWVFSSDAAPGPQVVRFLLVSLLFRLAEYLVFFILHYLLGIHYLAAVLIALLSFYLVKFFVYRDLVFTSGKQPVVPRLGRALAFAVLFFLVIEAGLFGTGIFLQISQPASYCGQVVAVLRNAANFQEESGDAQRVLVLGDSRMGEGFSARICDELGGGRRLWFNASVPGSTPRVWSYLLEELLRQGNDYDLVVLPLQSLKARTSERYMADRELDGQFMPPLLPYSRVYEYSTTFDKEPLRRKMLVRGFLRSFALRKDIWGFLLHPLRRLKDVAKGRAAYKSHYHYQGREEDLTDKVTLAGNNAVFAPEVPQAEQNQFVLLPEGPTEEIREKEAAYQRKWVKGIERSCLDSGAGLIIFLAPRGPLGAVYESEVEVDAHKQLGLSDETTVLPADTFSGLEKPEYFFDHLHMNGRGREKFSHLIYDFVAGTEKGKR